MRKLDFFKIGIIIVAAAALILLLSGTAIEIKDWIAGGSKPVKTGDMVKVEYTGSLENGTIFDSSEIQGQPLEFRAGAGQMIKGFDEAVIGMKVGQEKTITLKPSEAYGERNEELVATIPRKELQDERPIQPGMMILVGKQGSQQIPALVTEANENNFTIDLNHPLAGKTLIFRIKVVDIS